MLTGQSALPHWSRPVRDLTQKRWITFLRVTPVVTHTHLCTHVHMNAHMQTYMKKEYCELLTFGVVYYTSI